MVKRILNISETPEFFDATDALAIAVCHSMQFTKAPKSSSNWADYIKAKSWKNCESIVMEWFYLPSLNENISDALISGDEAKHLKLSF